MVHVRKRLKMCKSLTPVLWRGAFPHPQHVDTASSQTRHVNYLWANKCVLYRGLVHNIILGSVTALILHFLFIFYFFWMKLKWWNTRECFSFFFLVLAHFLQKPFFSSTRTFRCFNKYYMKYRMCRMCVSLWLFRANYSSNAHNIFTVTPKTNRNFKSLLFLLWKRLAHFLCTTSTLSHNHRHLPPGGRLAL